MTSSSLMTTRATGLLGLLIVNVPSPSSTPANQATSSEATTAGAARPLWQVRHWAYPGDLGRPQPQGDSAFCRASRHGLHSRRRSLETMGPEQVQQMASAYAPEMLTNGHVFDF